MRFAVRPCTELGGRIHPARGPRGNSVSLERPPPPAAVRPQSEVDRVRQRTRGSDRHRQPSPSAPRRTQASARSSRRWCRARSGSCSPGWCCSSPGSCWASLGIGRARAHLICRCLLSSGRGEAPPGWVLGGASSLWPWQGVSLVVSGSWSTACQSDMRGLGTAGRLLRRERFSLSRDERHPVARAAHRSVAGSFLALPPASVRPLPRTFRGYSMVASDQHQPASSRAIAIVATL